MTTTTPNSPFEDKSTHPELHLFDFDKATPKALGDYLTTALQNAQSELVALSDNAANTPNTTATAEQALATIHRFGDIVYDIERHFSVLSHLNSVVNSDDTRQIYDNLLPTLSAFYSKVGQSVALYRLYQQVLEQFDQLDTKHQSPEQRRAITLALQSFELSGVALDDDKKQQFADISQQLSQLSSTFSNNVLDATQDFAYPLHPDELAGLKPSGLALLKQAGEQYKQKNPNATLPSDYVATLDMPSYLAIMQYSDNRDLRQKLYLAYNARASDQHPELFNQRFDNAPIIEQILHLRQHKAALLGFNHYSQVSLASKMANSVDEVEQFLQSLARHATPFAKEELDELKALGATLGIDDVQAWDIAYLSEKLREQQYAIDSEALRAYFPLPQVLKGLFEITHNLFGVNIKPANASTWHSDVKFFELYDKDKLLGGFYLDLFARLGKKGGAWLSGYQSRHYFDQQYLPVGFIVANFSPPSDDKVACLSLDEVTTLFHEFGHALHHLLSETTVSEVAGINSVEWDAVELPSQFMENFITTNEGIAKISRHIDSGEPLPQETLSAILRAKNFQSGMQTLRQLEFALFDLSLHSTPTNDFNDVLALNNKIRQEIAVIQPPTSNRFANSFSHIFAGGYASGYYSYKWAELLSADAFGKFEDTGIFNPATGQAYRQAILSRAGGRSAKDNFNDFMGRDADINALLRHSGFVA